MDSLLEAVKPKLSATLSKYIGPEKAEAVTKEMTPKNANKVMDLGKKAFEKAGLAKKKDVKGKEKVLRRLQPGGYG